MTRDPSRREGDGSLRSPCSPVGVPAPTLVVDLDGTLTPTDTLIESILRIAKNRPIDLLNLPFWLLSGRAAFKKMVASHDRLPVETLPWRTELVEFLRAERRKGRRIVLATAADHDVADSVARHVGLFDDVISSDGTRNLKGAHKLRAIQERVGDRFVYAGDNEADLPVWRAACGAITVGVTPGVARTVAQYTPVEHSFPQERAGLGTWLSALRGHQWSKNVLLFVPLLTAFSFMDASRFVTMVIAFFAFSLLASSTYIVNDLWDLESDRSHPRKRNRPFASGRIPILHGLVVASGLLAAALLLAASVSQGFLLTLLIYLALTSAYSGVLKRYVLLDVVTLSLLYTLRIIAGSVAIAIAPSSWLLAFSVFVFLSLALVKRCSELVVFGKAGRDSVLGRDYRVEDLVVLWPLGVGAGLSAVVVFGLFINSPEIHTRYETPRLLWFAAIGLIYWLARLWIKTSRGEMHDDPVVYAMKDAASRTVLLAMIATVLAAHFLDLG